MIATPFHRRRTERFAQLIDEASGGRRHHVKATVDGNLAELVSVSRRLSDLPVKVETQPEFRDGLRAMLLATIERDGIGATAVAEEPAVTPRWIGSRLGLGSRSPAGTRPPMSRRTKTRGAIVVGLAAGTLALSGMSAASGSAVPGDPLYSVKRSTEKAQLALAGSDISRGMLYLEFAKTRLDEAQAVRNDPNGLTNVLNDMDSETEQGVKLLTTTAVAHRNTVALDDVDAFAAAQRAEAARLRDGVTGAAANRAGGSVTLLDEILRRSKALRVTLKCPKPVLGTPDAIGPLPTGTCKVPGTESTAHPRSVAPTGTPQQRSGTSTVAPTAGVTTEPAPPVETDTPDPTETTGHRRGSGLDNSDNQDETTQAPPTDDPGDGGWFDGLNHLLGG